MNYNKYKRGSEWRKWDLHIHTPGTKKNDQYKLNDGDVWDLFCQRIKESDVSVFGITDYFSVDNYFIFIEKFQKKYPNSKKKFFPIVELCTNDVVNTAKEEVNIHIIFNTNIANLQDCLEKFIQNLKTNKTIGDDKYIKASELSSELDYEEATTTRAFINTAIQETFGHKVETLDYLLIFTAANNDGLRTEIEGLGDSTVRGQKRKAVITDELDKFSHGFFGNVNNVDYFQKIDRLENKDEKIKPKPVISGSDVHSFDDLDKWLGKRFCVTDKNGQEIIVKDVTWIKSDPTFEGLKQIIYESASGDRVFIGPTKPDKKDEYKVIRKIIFDSKDIFPEEVEFNSNLCSIIGSRSSGKSALLAYLAHAIDKDLAEKRMPDGPGAGIPWSSVDFSYKIEWLNGLNNDESHGQIVYIPQNYLFKISSQPDEIKDKIEPVFFKLLPDFKNRYIGVLESIKNHNINIENVISDWFFNANKILELTNQIKSLGDKGAIQGEIKKTESRIEEIKKKFRLTEEDVKEYQKISISLKRKEERITNINHELIQIISQLENQLENSDFFKKITLELEPSLGNLPESLKSKILEEIAPHKSNILKKINIIVQNYKAELETGLTELKKEIDEEKTNNKSLIEKNEKNKELQALVEDLNNQNILIERIKKIEKIKEESSMVLQENEKTIKEEIKKRKSALDRLLLYLNSLNQDDFDIVFGLEYGIDNDFQEALAEKINKVESSVFFDKGKLKLEEMRNNPINFIQKIYSGKQKINAGYDGKDVVKEAFMLTEKILFTAEMEGDKIGGFQKSTMTAGKQALFALKLILGESDDKWPLLIDQPEDDLDSRSIYYHIVPFLKRKKKERQIIMVSHNANLVIGADSEQIIVSNRKGDDRPNEDGKEFNYFSGSIENTKVKDKKCKDTLRSQGIREHACDILDGGETAFEHRRNKYNLTKYK